MSNIIYYGSKDSAYELKIYCKKNKIELNNHFVSEIDLSQIYEDVMSNIPSHLFIDIDCVINKDEEIIDNLTQIQKAIHSVVCIVAIGYNVDMRIIRNLIAGGIMSFILSERLTIQRQEIKTVIESGSTIPGMKRDVIISEKEKQINKVFNDIPETMAPVKTEMHNKLRIAVVGCRDRIGTTTVALQLAKYLQLHNKKACYLERNNSNFVETFAEYIDGADIDNTLGKLSYDKIDMFFRPEVINRVLQSDYEVYIYDYGSIASADAMSLLEQDLVIAVCGNFPTELKDNNKLYEKVENHSAVFYFFNFVETQDYENILFYQGNKKDRTYFFSYCPDPFLFRQDNTKCFTDVLCFDNTNIKSVIRETKRKRGFLK